MKAPSPWKCEDDLNNGRKCRNWAKFEVTRRSGAKLLVCGLHANIWRHPPYSAPVRALASGEER